MNISHIAKGVMGIGVARLKRVEENSKPQHKQAVIINKRRTKHENQTIRRQGHCKED